MFGDLDWPPDASRRFVSISWASCYLRKMMMLSLAFVCVHLSFICQRNSSERCGQIAMKFSVPTASVTELINFCNQAEVISVTGGPEVRHLKSMGCSELWPTRNRNPWIDYQNSWLCPRGDPPYHIWWKSINEGLLRKWVQYSVLWLIILVLISAVAKTWRDIVMANPSVRPSVCSSHSGSVSKWMDTLPNYFHHVVGA